MLDGVTVSGAGRAQPPRFHNMSFSAWGITSAGAGSATVLIEASNHPDIEPPEGTWVLLGTLTLVLQATLAAGVPDGLAINAAWRKVRMRVSAIAGTGAAVTGYIGG